jgi:hypothetical protein
MAVISGINTAINTVGAREDLANTITLISPEETPLWTNSTKKSATAINHEWQTDELDVSSTNSSVEGDTITTSTAAPTVRLGNLLQISRKTYGVSGTVQALNLAGRSDELLRLRMKKGLELRRDMEVVLHTNQAKRADSTGGTARLLGGLPTWITNVAGEPGYSSGNGDGSSAISGSSTTALAYEYVASAMQMAFEDGGNPDLIEVPPVLKRKFSLLAFGTAPSTAQIRYNVDSAGQAIAVGAVEKWQSDFGLVDIIVNRQLKIQTATFLRQALFILDTSKLSTATLRNFEIGKLAKTGDATQEFVLAEYTLQPDAPNAHAACYGMT